MSGVNKAILIGHVGKDPELRFLNDNTAVVSFPLATSEFFNKGGVRTEHTEWHNIVMRKDLAELAARVLKKDLLVHIEGKCRTRSFDDKDGVHRYIMEVVADTFTLIGRANDFEVTPDKQAGK